MADWVGECGRVAYARVYATVGSKGRDKAGAGGVAWNDADRVAMAARAKEQ